MSKNHLAVSEGISELPIWWNLSVNLLQKYTRRIAVYEWK